MFSVRKTFVKKISPFVMLFLSMAFIFFGVFFVNKSNNESSDAVTYPSYYCIRDDYYVQMTDQGQFGTCWAFANIKSIEAWLAKQTGEHFEISESYVAIHEPYQDLVGNGGNAFFVTNAVKETGFIVDSDLSYEDIYFLNNENHEYILSGLSEKADKHTVTIQSTMANGYLNNQSKIKEYITTYGNCSVSIDYWDLVVNPYNGTNEIGEGITRGHALNVLGWDDNYVASNGSKGAYIILNSHGDFTKDGIVYLPYSSSIAGDVDMYSYKLALPSDYVYLNSNANYQVNMKNKYSTASGFTAEKTTLKERNIFDVDDDYRLDYTFPEKNNLKFNVNIYSGNVNVNDDFSILKDDYHCYILRKENLLSGSYKIVFDYSYTEGNKTINRSIIKQLFLLDGLEINLIEKRNENQVRENIVVDSVSMVDNKIYIPQYFVNSAYSNVIELGFAFSPYSNYTSFAFKKGSTTLKNGVVSNYDSTEDYKLSIMLNASTLTSATNTFTLELANNKHSKTYYIFINKDTGTYEGEGGTNTKFTSYLNIDLEGGTLEENYQDRILLNNNQFSKFYLENPVKEGYKFTGYQYLNSSNEWTALSYDSLRKQYYVTKSNVRHATTDNYYTLYFYNYNFRNSILVRAIYTENPNPIILSNGTTEGDTFATSDNITVSLSNLGATSISWTIDGVSYGNEQCFVLSDMKPGNFKIKVSFVAGGTSYEYTKTLFIKCYVYNVTANQTEFAYNTFVQVPEITIDGLILNTDYTIEAPESKNAGTYTLVIKPANDYILLTETEISYTITPLPFTITFNNQMIKMGESISGFMYTATGWIEDEDLQVNFDISNVNVWKAGTYSVPVTFGNMTNNYEVAEFEKPAVVVVATDFNVEDISCVSKDLANVEHQTFSYGQTFSIGFDCERAMIASASYTLNGKVYNNKVQYITEKIPVGEYTITANAILVNGQTLERTFNIEIVKARIKIIAVSTQGDIGNQPKNLTYKIESDDNVDDLTVELEVVDFNKDKLGQYVIRPIVSGEAMSNYEIEIVDGVYTVIQGKGISTNNRVILGVMIGLVLVLGVANLIFIRRRAKKQK